MLLRRGGAISRLLEDLAAGDPVTWGFIGVLALIGIGLGLFTLKVRRDLAREDAQRGRGRRA